jgi:hypothetical protein
LGYNATPDRDGDTPEDFLLDEVSRSCWINADFETVEVRVSAVEVLKFEANADGNVEPGFLMGLSVPDAFQVAATFERRAQGVGDGLTDEAQGIHQGRGC